MTAGIGRRPGNNIAVAQETPEMLRLLAAQRRLYRTAKRLLAWDLVLSVGVPAALIALGLRWPTLGPWTTAVGLVTAMTDYLLLDRLQRRRRERGARIQEQFDVHVLELPWNTERVGRREDPETIAAAARRLSDAHEQEKLRRWYPTVVASVPIGHARLICQRTSCRWDEALRRDVSTACKATVAVIAIGTVVVGLLGGWSIVRTLTVLAGPLAPLIARCVREWVRQDEAVQRLAELRRDIATAWDACLDGSLRDDGLLRATRHIQDRIFEHRRDAPLISERMYSWRKGEHQFQADAAAEVLVGDAVAKLPP